MRQVDAKISIIKTNDDAIESIVSNVNRPTNWFNLSVMKTCSSCFDISSTSNLLSGFNERLLFLS